MVPDPFVKHLSTGETKVKLAPLTAPAMFIMALTGMMSWWAILVIFVLNIEVTLRAPQN